MDHGVGWGAYDLHEYDDVLVDFDPSYERAGDAKWEKRVGYIVSASYVFNSEQPQI